MNKNIYILDRIENDIAVLLCGDDEIRLSVASLPEVVRDGDAFIRDENGIFVRNDDETRRREKKARSLLDSLFKKNQ